MRVALSALAVWAPAAAYSLNAPCTDRAGAFVPQCGRSVQCSMKETTIDRLTGPKLFKTVAKVEGIHAVPLVPLRVLTGVLMIHHGSEGGFWPANYGSPGFEGFVVRAQKKQCFQGILSCLE